MAIFNAGTIDLSRKADIIKILRFEKEQDHIEYVIQVKLDEIKWTVRRRYNEFSEFDRKRFKRLTKSHSLLPPKKIIGNMEDSFLEKRMTELESYLHTIFELEVYLQRRRQRIALPRDISEFLDFISYELSGVLESLAAEIYEKGDSVLSSDDFFEMTPFQLWAIDNRLRLPEPSYPGEDRRHDFSYVIDFVHRLRHLKVNGSNIPVGTSNINMNSLPFSTAAFKSLTTIWLMNCNSTAISSLGIARQTVTCLIMHASLKHLKDILCVDMDADLRDDKQCSLEWQSLTEADFSSNLISDIDDSIAYLRHVTKLNLSDNQLTDIAYLHHLPFLEDLDLSENRLENLHRWNRKLGNIKRLTLFDNRITSLRGIHRLYSLEYLDVRNNSLIQIKDIWWAGRLPCLETLLLSGNAVESSVEYRTRALEAFGDRANEVKLDGKKASEKELDTVGVRMAIRKAREDRELLLKRANEEMSRRLDDPFSSLTFAVEKVSTANSIADAGDSTESATGTSFKQPQSTVLE